MAVQDAPHFAIREKLVEIDGQELQLYQTVEPEAILY